MNFFSVASKKLLLIFTRNPVLGQCKTRLAATIGEENALEIYRFLVRHTAYITQNVPVAKQVWYADEIWENDQWPNTLYEKRLQTGQDLGERMANAFKTAFEVGFEQCIIMGTDMYDLGSQDIEQAFNLLETANFVVGPAEDGGYYLLGMKNFNPQLFKNKQWGKNTVLAATLKDLDHEKVALLPVKNDIDVYEDIKDLNVFKPYLKNR